MHKWLWENVQPLYVIQVPMKCSGLLEFCRYLHSKVDLAAKTFLLLFLSVLKIKIMKCVADAKLETSAKSSNVSCSKDTQYFLYVWSRR
jgi:hypothetical protein